MFAFVIVVTLAGQLVSYVDEEGTTHYVDSPSKIPAKYRKQAKPLGGEVGTIEQQKPKETEPAYLREAKEQWLREEQLREQKANAAKAREKVRAPAAPVVDPNSPAERRRRWDEAQKQKPEVTVTPGGRTQVRYQGADGLKPLESCHMYSQPCAVPPECCSNICNPKTFKCE